MSAVGDLVAVDTSVALPLLLSNHEAHEQVTLWWAGRRLTLSGHALPETYSVLTRLPGGLRLEAADAARLIDARFEAPVVLSARRAAALHRDLATTGVAGGRVYDAIVAWAAKDAGLPLSTRDFRALQTYQAVGVATEIVTARASGRAGPSQPG